MTRPLADTDATTNIFSVVGTQRNYGVELFAQGNVTPELSVLGGDAWISMRGCSTRASPRPTTSSWSACRMSKAISRSTITPTSSEALRDRCRACRERAGSDEYQ